MVASRAFGVVQGKPTPQEASLSCFPQHDETSGLRLSMRKGHVLASTSNNLSAQQNVAQLGRIRPNLVWVHRKPEDTQRQAAS